MGLFNKTIGIKRVEAKITQTNLAYNIEMVSWSHFMDSLAAYLRCIPVNQATAFC